MMAVPGVDGQSLSSALLCGSELSCTTTEGDTLRGNVVAVDDVTRVVVIKEGDLSSSGNIHIINLSHVSDMSVLSPPSSPPPPLPEINLQKVQRRMRQNIEAKWKEVNSRGVNVSDEAQLLFDSIRKLYDDIRWEGSEIVVLGDVRISPPYSSKDCTGPSTAVPHIQKLVTKFHEDMKSSPSEK